MTWDVFARAVLHLYLGGQAVGSACAARMANVFSDDQIKALLKVINKEKGGWKKFIEETRRKK